MRAGFLLTLCLLGCQPGSDRPEVVWGRRGVVAGDFIKPRAIAIDAQDRLYLVDWTARIQVFDRDGKFLNISFKTPDFSTADRAA